ncbi:MAG TPA: T9SS type A sorting domain-containing protein [candidate division WOR-3 bacterium]|uniref:T9SS type A sorting domain-containing protein n=1 Tax=candidate division WOR-3 bacterium TaxID=2052148 RepID=A0A9C9K037_UNCW3|nr:T9SS type A sorting domain-containing protein [candidate division WOR-3 bacterium]
MTVIIFSFGASPAVTHYEALPRLRGDEKVEVVVGPPYLGGRQSPGDQIGTTAYDIQQVCGGGGSAGHRLMVDDYGQAHIDWMWQDYPGQTMRYCAWNARFTDGTYYGETQASGSWSGYVQIDITRDSDPDSQRSVIAYQYDAGTGYYSWIDIDGVNLGGFWPNDPKTPGVADHIWPVICVANNNNILMATGDYNAAEHHLYLTTDLGETWMNIFNFDSCATLSYYLCASKNPTSQKVVFTHTQFITDSLAAGQLDNDVWYMISTDNGMTWGECINLTEYQPTDTMRACCDPYAIFDADDVLHIVWTVRKVDTAAYYQASKILHWDELNDTVTVVNSPSIYYNEPGGWWIGPSDGGNYGAWRVPADKPVLICDTTDNYLYCIWGGNDDYTDSSAAGYINDEIYGAFSTDRGLTWSDYVNLTNTRAPGAEPGACYDEDWATAHLTVVHDSIFVTYVEDKDAGSCPHGEGTLTENPVRCWVFPTSLITGACEESKEEPLPYDFEVYPNPFSRLLNVGFGKGRGLKNIEVTIFDVSGREVLKKRETSGISETVKLDTRDLACGVYFIGVEAGGGAEVRKVVKVK